MMTAPMIEWTLEVLEWVRAQLFEQWPEARMRASAPELNPEGYTVRFRDQGRQFWLVLTPEAISKTSVADERTLLEAQDWIQKMRSAGTLSVGVADESAPQPILRSRSTMEVKLRPS